MLRRAAHKLLRPGPAQHAVRGPHAPRKDFLWPRDDWYNYARAPEKLSVKLNQVR
jgi:hypothetical protein